jgi:subtilase family serine protease
MAMAMSVTTLLGASLTSTAGGIPLKVAVPIDRVCPPADSGHATCFAEKIHSAAGAHPSLGALGLSPTVVPSVTAYSPGNLTAAYGFPSKANTTIGNSQTVAIVVAYDDPNAEADLGHYRAQFGLRACTKANGCFRKVNQNGLTTPLPSPDISWAGEASLDLDMVSAICPNCKILLVEANSNSYVNLATAVDRAATMGAKQINNSYGGAESSSAVALLGTHYNHPGVAIVASSGDNGYFAGPQVPAALPTVIGVGGTTLYQRPGTTRGWEESAWGGAGSGCSSFVPMPGFQSSNLPANRKSSCSTSYGGNPGRQVADISAVADPTTGVWVYDTYLYGGGGWQIFGGTSASSPIITAAIALAGNAANLATPIYRRPYINKTLFSDVLAGANGTCAGDYLCTASSGYDGPTGLGSPLGLGGL